MDKRDIIMISGQNAVGKSTAMEVLKQVLRSQCTQVKEIAFGYKRLFEKIVTDTEGEYHFHPTWHTESNPKNIKGHIHKDTVLHPYEPFTEIGNTLNIEVLQEKFNSLENLSYLPNQIILTDLARGVNTNPSQTVEALADYSFQLTKKLMHKNVLPVKWLTRVKVWIHITMKEDLRWKAFSDRNLLSISKSQKSHLAWVKSTESFHMFGNDDFSEFSEVLQSANIPYIFSINNDLTPRFFQNIKEKIKIISLNRTELVRNYLSEENLYSL